MHDALGQARSPIDQVAAAFAVTPARADAVLRAVMPEFTWRLETMTLSRGGLADLVEILGRVHNAADPAPHDAVRRDGEAILARLLGTKDASRSLAARAARHCGLEATTVAAMLPHLAVVATGDLARRANTSLGEVLAQLPPLGCLSRGSPHADLADILRRRCGAGIYSPRALPRAVRRSIAAGAGLPRRSIVGWYLGFMAGRRVARLLRSVALWVRNPAVPDAGR